MSDPTLASTSAAAGAESTDAEAHPIDFSGPYYLAPDEDADEQDEAAPGDQGADALIEKLLPLSFADRGFLLPDAPSAGRFALQTIRAFQKAIGRPKRNHLIYCAGPSKAPLPAGLTGADGIEVFTTDDPGTLLGAITPRTAGILIAPVRTTPIFEETNRGLLAVLREATDDCGIVFAFDETESGMCRTGMIWSYEWTGVAPDLMIVGAGLAGSSPLAGVLTTERVARGATPPGPVNEATLAEAHKRADRILNVDFASRVQSRAWALEDQLAQLSYRHRSIYTAVTGLGLMQGLVCAEDAKPLAERAAAAGLLTKPMGNVLGLFPALTVSEAEIELAISILNHIAMGMEAG